jgi:hypothetical protein
MQNHIPAVSGDEVELRSLRAQLELCGGLLPV